MFVSRHGGAAVLSLLSGGEQGGEHRQNRSYGGCALLDDFCWVGEAPGYAERLSQWQLKKRKTVNKKCEVISFCILE